MAEYMLTLPGMMDPEMPDGTMGFAMALARENAKLVELILAYYHKNPQNRRDERERDIRIAEDAVLELEENSPMRSVLEKMLRILGHERRVRASRKPRCRK